MKKFIKNLLIICLIVPCVFLLAGCNQANASSELTLSVNPEVSFILDANNNVLSVKYGNTDADIIYADVNFVGKDVDSSIELFIERAAISGHVNLTGDEVSVKINGKTDVDVEALRTKVQTKVNEVFEKLGVDVRLDIEKLTIEAQKEVLIAKAKILAPEKTLEELNAMTNEELLQLINTKQKELKDLTCEQVSNINDKFSDAQNSIAQAIQTAKESLSNFEAQLNELEKAYGEQIPEPIKVQMNILKDQINDLKKQIDAKVNQFLNNRKNEIQNAQTQYKTLKEQLKREFKTQVETSKQNLINHLTTSKNNGTITEEQYNYWVSLIENQTK